MSASKARVLLSRGLDWTPSLVELRTVAAAHGYRVRPSYRGSPMAWVLGDDAPCCALTFREALLVVCLADGDPRRPDSG